MKFNNLNLSKKVSVVFISTTLVFAPVYTSFATQYENIEEETNIKEEIISYVLCKEEITEDKKIKYMRVVCRSKEECDKFIGEGYKLVDTHKIVTTSKWQETNIILSKEKIDVKKYETDSTKLVYMGTIKDKYSYYYRVLVKNIYVDLVREENVQSFTFKSEFDLTDFENGDYQIFDSIYEEEKQLEKDKMFG